MKRPFAVFLLLAWLSFSLTAEGFQFSNLLFGLRTDPEKDGNGFLGYAGYKYSDSLSSEAIVKNAITAENVDDFISGEGVVSSYSLLRENQTDIFVLPLEYSLRFIGASSLKLGAGLYVSLDEQKYLGYFNVESGDVDSYDVNRSSTFFGPVLSAESSLDFGFFSLDPRIIYVPYFRFSQAMDLAIKPALTAWGTGSTEFDSAGYPYLSVSVENLMVSVGKFIGIDWLSLGGGFSYEYSVQNGRTISNSGSAAAPAWVVKDDKVSSVVSRYLFKVGVRFDNGSTIGLGIGRKLGRASETVDGDTSTTTQSKAIYSLSYDIKR